MHTILVVDDDPDCCNMLAKLLATVGETALCVTGGQLALDSLQRCIPKLVILDLMMPDVGGLEVLRHIRSNRTTAHLPVVIFSAMGDPKYEADAMSKGATDFWVKGQIDFKKLHQLVAPYLALPAA
jgi:CheY-like chemotaxis protein